MSIFKNIRTLDNKFAWSFVGVLLALIFGGIGIYAGFFYERKPGVMLEIISNTPVFDVRENVSKLEVLFAGNNIKQSGQALRVITLRIINDGQQDILKTFYDENDPLGFIIINGSLVEPPELLHASNDYLSKNLRLSVTTPTQVSFNSVILEVNQFYTIKLLVLSPEGAVPDIIPSGKIAGISTINVSRSYLQRNDVSFLGRTFAGTPFVQTVRVLVYGVAFLICVIALFAGFFSFLDIRDKLKRKRLLSKFRTSSVLANPSTAFTADDQRILNLYTRSGEWILSDLKSALESESLADDLRSVVRRNALTDAEDRERAMHVELISRGRVIFSKQSFQVLLDEKFVELDDDTIRVNDTMKNTLDRLVAFLQENGALRVPTATAETVMRAEAQKT